MMVMIVTPASAQPGPIGTTVLASDPEDEVDPDPEEDPDELLLDVLVPAPELELLPDEDPDPEL
jgi:hypothetical protein